MNVKSIQLIECMWKYKWWYKTNVKRLKDLREDKDKSQSDIAKILKITQQQYSLYETGLRLIPIDKLCILADYYKTSTDYILGRTNTK